MPEPVTFLFTDIEGSTRLWQEFPEAMGAVLPRHDAALRAAVEAAGGRVFKTGGDGLCAVFARAPEAVAAALEAQRALAPYAAGGAPGLPQGFRLRVRAALHAGPAQERDGDYYGVTLSRAARLLEAAHGGQTLLTGAVEALVRHALPSGALLRDLGTHRLRDLSERVLVFQLLHPDVPPENARIRSLDAFAHNLPAPVSNFIGREREMAELRRHLGETRLLTLTGSGGAGKTRLAIQVGASSVAEFPDGVWLVELAALAAASPLVPEAIAAAIGVKEEPVRPVVETLAEHLRARAALLILDNCEHLVDPCAAAVGHLLAACPALRILATSREPLHIPGERAWRVPSLALPDEPPPGDKSAAAIQDSEAVRLFRDRAAAVAAFTLTPQNAPAVARICRRLDGMPLAIELAAARVGALSPQQIDQRLDDRFRLLTRGHRTALPRHQTLAALIDWSYDLLSERERTALRRVAVFAGGWSLEAAEAVCADEEGAPVHRNDVLELLARLVDKSLVTADTEAPAGTRYRMLESIREYALRALAASGEAERVRGCHLRWFAELAERAAPELRRTGREEWLDRLATEQDNLRAALDWSDTPEGDARSGLRLAGALWRFWYIRGPTGEGRERLERALQRNPAPDRDRAEALNGAGILTWRQRDLDGAQARFTQALAIRRATDDREGAAGSLNNLALIARDRGDLPTARRLFDESLAAYRDLGDRAHVAILLGNLGALLHEMKDLEGARRFLEESLSVHTDPDGLATTHFNLGNLLVELDDLAAGKAQLCRSLRMRAAAGDQWHASRSLEALGCAALRQGRHREGARLIGAADALREAAGDLNPPPGSHRREQMALAAAALGDASLAAALDEGRRMTLDAAMDLALECV